MLTDIREMNLVCKCERCGFFCALSDLEAFKGTKRYILRCADRELTLCPDCIKDLDDWMHALDDTEPKKEPSSDPMADLKKALAELGETVRGAFSGLGKG